MSNETKKQKCIFLEPSIMARVEWHQSLTGISFSELVRRSLIEYIDARSGESEKG